MAPDTAVVKRALDLTASAAGLLISAPIMGVVAIAIRAKLGSPVLFRQERPGLNGTSFHILKFRTMLEPDASQNLVTNEQRMTPFGAILRSTSLDELPSLINVLRGDLSLVGPRPLRMAYLDRYSDEQMKRHTVRPGLTGLAQISGRNSLTWDERLRLDVDYVERVSIKRDFRILCNTVAKVLKREGISSSGQATMSEFFGPEFTSDLSIRALDEADLPTRADWLREPSIREGISIDFWPDAESMRAWYERVSEDASRVDYVTFSHGSGELQAMLGIVALGQDSGELYIYVNPKSQGRGYGRQSMQLLLTKARQLGLTAISLETKTTNERSIRLYQRLGFVRIDQRSSDSKMTMTRSLT
ncbi:GNAT family N-acetyltransferase [Cellulosimicrobium funkei]|nr:GNAT family N-acetyltransferase [Cellulosimicrobium funkei]